MIPLERWIRERLGGRRAAVVGVGNRLRGDDGAGPCLAERLAAAGGAALDAGTVPENYLVPLLESAPEVVLFADAADHGAAPGAAGVAAMEDLAGRPPSTHAPSLALLSEILAERGVECWLLAIQPAATARPDRLSAPVEHAVREAAGALERALARGGGHA